MRISIYYSSQPKILVPTRCQVWDRELGIKVPKFGIKAHPLGGIPVRVLAPSDVECGPCEQSPVSPFLVVQVLSGGIQGPPRSLLPTILQTAKTGVPRSSIPELKAFQNAQLILGLPPSEYTSTPSFFPTGPSSKKGMRWRCLNGERLQGRGAPPAPSG